MRVTPAAPEKVSQLYFKNSQIPIYSHLPLSTTVEIVDETTPRPPTRSPSSFCPPLLTASSFDFSSNPAVPQPLRQRGLLRSSSAWKAKVMDLAERGVTVRELLSFYRSLSEQVRAGGTGWSEGKPGATRERGYRCIWSIASTTQGGL